MRVREVGVVILAALLVVACDLALTAPMISNRVAVSNDNLIVTHCPDMNSGHATIRGTASYRFWDGVTPPPRFTPPKLQVERGCSLRQQSVDSFWRFDFQNLTAGRNWISVENPDTSRYKVISDSLVAIDLPAKDTAVTVEFELTLIDSNIIVGEVRDGETGKGVGGLPVFLYRDGEELQKAYTTEQDFWNYGLGLIAPGDYVVRLIAGADSVAVSGIGYGRCSEPMDLGCSEVLSQRGDTTDVAVKFRGYLLLATLHFDLYQ